MALRATNSAFALTITDSSLVGEARRRALALSKDCGFRQEAQGKLGLIVTEAGNNLINHAKQGELVVSALGKGTIEVLALDQGPGISNISECLRDGYSTRGTPGTGLGAIRRLATFFDIHSRPSVGTAILARICESDHLEPEFFDVGSLLLPFPGETACGDGWAIKKFSSSRLQLLVSDGLGHGSLAAEASSEARETFFRSQSRSLIGILDEIHSALRKTRGAAIGLFEINTLLGEVKFTGIGNIAGIILLPGEKVGCASLPGIVGHEIRKAQVFTYRWDSKAILIANSDGLKTRWDLDSPSYAGLLTKSPSLIAGVLYRDFRREKDDVTVVSIGQRGNHAR